MNKKLYIKLIYCLIAILITSFCFYKFGLWQVISVYPKDIKPDYRESDNSKEEEIFGFVFLLPKNFIFAKKKSNIVAYRTENNNITFIIKKGPPDLFIAELKDKYENDYEFYDKILTNRWNIDYFMPRYLMLSKWRFVEIKRIKVNNLKGFIFLGERKNQRRDYTNYLYELFDKDYRLTIAVRIDKKENFGEKEINYIISKLKQENTIN